MIVIIDKQFEKDSLKYIDLRKIFSQMETFTHRTSKANSNW